MRKVKEVEMSNASRAVLRDAFVTTLANSGMGRIYAERIVGGLEQLWMHDSMEAKRETSAAGVEEYNYGDGTRYLSKHNAESIDKLLERKDGQGMVDAAIALNTEVLVLREELTACRALLGAPPTFSVYVAISEKLMELAGLKSDRAVKLVDLAAKAPSVEAFELVLGFANSEVHVLKDRHDSHVGKVFLAYALRRAMSALGYAS